MSELQVIFMGGTFMVSFLTFIILLIEKIKK